MADFSCQLVSQAVWHGFSRKKNDLLRQARQKTYNNKKQYYIMNIKPLADRVLILPAPAEEKTIGGIIIPDTATQKTKKWS